MCHRFHSGANFYRRKLKVMLWTPSELRYVGNIWVKIKTQEIEILTKRLHQGVHQGKQLCTPRLCSDHWEEALTFKFSRNPHTDYRSVPTLWPTGRQLGVKLWVIRALRHQAENIPSKGPSIPAALVIATTSIYAQHYRAQRASLQKSRGARMAQRI